MNSIQSVKEIKVGIHFGDGVRPVGRLAIHNRQIYFEYDQFFIKDILKLATEAKIKKNHAAEIIDATKISLAKWPILARQYGVSDISIRLIQNKINRIN